MCCSLGKKLNINMKSVNRLRQEHDKTSIEHGYCKEEMFVRLHGSVKLNNFLDNLRISVNIEKDRPIFLHNSVLPCFKNILNYQENVLAKYFSIHNYEKLINIIREDFNSLEFKLNIS